MNQIRHDPDISLYNFTVQLNCNKHGIFEDTSKKSWKCAKLHHIQKSNIQERKQYNLFRKSLKKFIIYLFQIKYPYHGSYVNLLDKLRIAADQKNAFKPDETETTCGYAKRLSPFGYAKRLSPVFPQYPKTWRVIPPPTFTFSLSPASDLNLTKSIISVWLCLQILKPGKGVPLDRMWNSIVLRYRTVGVFLSNWKEAPLCKDGSNIQIPSVSYCCRELGKCFHIYIVLHISVVNKRHTHPKKEK